MSIYNEPSSISNGDAVIAGNGVTTGAVSGAALPVDRNAVARRGRGRPLGSRGASAVGRGAARELVVVNPNCSVFKRPHATTTAASASTSTPRKEHQVSESDVAGKKAKVHTASRVSFAADDADDEDSDERNSVWFSKANGRSIVVPRVIMRDATAAAVVATEGTRGGERHPIDCDLNEDEADDLIRNLNPEHECESNC